MSENLFRMRNSSRCSDYIKLVIFIMNILLTIFRLLCCYCGQRLECQCIPSICSLQFTCKSKLTWLSWSTENKYSSTLLVISRGTIKFKGMTECYRNTDKDREIIENLGALSTPPLLMKAPILQARMSILNTLPYVTLQ